MAAKIQINLIELAWAAGIFDGEGCTCFSKSSYYNSKGKQMRYRLSVSIGQTHNSFPIHRFRNAIQMGNVTTDSSFKTKWVVSTFEEVQASIAMIWSFLCPRKKQQYKEALKNWRQHKCL